MASVKQTSRWLIASLAVLLGGAGNVSAAPGGMVVDNVPLNLQGTSGGTVASDCGNISAQPSQRLQLTEAFISRSGYLRFVVEGQGDPTLLIEGPTGRFCVLSDQAMHQGPEAVGYWLPGTYNIYVGDRSNQRHPYSLSIVAE